MTRSRWSIFGICIATVAVAICAIITLVASVHRQGYCISQLRTVPEQEMFAKAVMAVYSHMPLGVETLQDIRIGLVPTDGPSLNSTKPSRASATLADRVNRLMATRSYREACCKWGWKNVDRIPPTLLETIRGVMPEGVVVTVNVVTVSPDAITPAPHQIAGSGDWLSDAERVQISGPIIWQKRRDVTVAMDVCGNPTELSF